MLPPILLPARDLCFTTDPPQGTSIKAKMAIQRWALWRVARSGVKELPDAGYYDLPGVRRPLKPRQACSSPCRSRLWRRDRAREVEMLRNRDHEVRALLQAALRKLEDQP